MPNPWVTPAQGLAFVRILQPTPSEQDWADKLADGVNGAILTYIGPDTPISPDADKEITAAAYRAFGYGWKYREAPFGEAQYLDQQGGVAIRLAEDWIEPIKPILDRYRDVTQMIG